MAQTQGLRGGSPGEQKRARLDIRATMGQKKLIERAAALEGRSVSEYVLAHVQPAAEQAIQEREVIMLTASESVQLIEALLNPPAPNAQLRAAWQGYRETLGG